MPQDQTPTQRARSLRSSQTPAELALWSVLRAHRLDGIKFSRQVPVGPYILDFAARARRLAIEVDGDTHSRQVDYDAARTRFLERQGYRVIRFANLDVMTNIDGVAAAILQALRALPSPNPLPAGERVRAS